jgi:hypothetical protein
VTGTVIWRNGEYQQRVPIVSGKFDPSTGALKIEGEAKRPDNGNPAKYTIEGRSTNKRSREPSNSTTARGISALVGNRTAANVRSRDARARERTVVARWALEIARSSVAGRLHRRSRQED